VLVDSPDGVDPPAVQEALRRGLGIRVEVAAVPPRSLPRYELKARRVVRR
jgi:phenylacetate-coenzyme A ligase PaaK-like adenylate-forming protein